jgi:hypothetical protein
MQAVVSSCQRWQQCERGRFMPRQRSVVGLLAAFTPGGSEVESRC